MTNSTIKYQKASEIATDEGFRPGSHGWWVAIKYHMRMMEILNQDAVTYHQKYFNNMEMVKD